MPILFVIARDWTMRTAVRAELRERGVDALGMDSPEDAGRAIAAGQMPAALVLECTSEFVSDPGIQNLMSRVPTLLIASRTEKIPAPAQSDAEGSTRKYLGAIVYRPVQIGEIVSRVLDLLHQPRSA